MKKAFTLAEAILTMTILGVIAATMVTTLKPQQYKAQAFRTLKQKAYISVDQVTQSVMTDCTTASSLAYIHAGCDRTAATHAFGTSENIIYNQFLRGTTGAVDVANGTCLAKSGYSTLRMRNGICLYFKSTEIFVDTNGNEGPNDSTEQFTISITPGEGVASDMP